MSKKIKEIKPFRQVPTYEPDAVLTITGPELETIQNILNIFSPAIEISRSIMDRNINEGNIKIKYIQQDGTEITEDEARAYLQQAAQYLQENEKTPN